MIAINRTLRAEAERLLPVLERIKAPGQPEDLLGVLIKHAPTFGVQAKSAGEWAALFGAYLDALDGLSVYTLEDAFLRWNRGEIYGLASGRHSFYPKPAELYQLAEVTKRELVMASYRAARALEYVEKEGIDWTPERKAAERQKAIDLGYLNADGSPNLCGLKPKTMLDVAAERPRQSPQQVAANLRAAAPSPPRQAAADEVGDVI